MQEDVLENLYKLLKEKVEPEKETKEINLDPEAIKEKAFKELIEEYEKEYKKAEKELLEFKVEDVKEAQRKKLAKYCQQFGINLEINLEEDSSDKEGKINEKMEELKMILDILKGKSRLGKTAADNIKDLGI